MHDDGYQLDMRDGAFVYVHRWLPPQPARAALLVIHGMAEHGARYARLAAAANAAGWALYALDLPGHGRSVRQAGELGHFADRDGWAYALATIERAREQVQREQGERPLVMLGHSMGSFLLQHYLTEPTTRAAAGLAGAVLSASSGSMGPLRPLGLQLMRLQARLYGPRHRSALAEALSFKAFNRKFRPTRTSADWLSRDAAEVDRYVADPLCGFRCSARLWADLLAAGGALLDRERLARIPKALPVLLIAGGDDAVSQGARGPEMLAQAYRRAGLSDVEVRIYPGGRHELLNEIPECRNQVTAELLSWMERKARAECRD